MKKPSYTVNNNVLFMKIKISVPMRVGYFIRLQLLETEEFNLNSTFRKMKI